MNWLEFLLGAASVALFGGLLISGWRQKSLWMLPVLRRARWNSDPVAVVIGVAAYLIFIGIGLFFVAHSLGVQS